MDQTDNTGDSQTTDSSEPGKRRFSSGGILLFFFIAVLALLALQYFWPQDRSGEQAGVGSKLPGLHLAPLTGNSQPVRLQDLAGKVVLLDFWGTWCPPCRAEFPHIAAPAAKYRDVPDFRVIPVSCRDESDDPDSLRPETEAFLHEHKFDLPMYADPGFYSRLQVDKVAGFDGYPTTLLLDRESVIRAIWVGYSPGTEEQISAKVAKLLAEKTTIKK